MTTKQVADIIIAARKDNPLAVFTFHVKGCGSIVYNESAGPLELDEITTVKNSQGTHHILTEDISAITVVSHP